MSILAIFWKHRFLLLIIFVSTFSMLPVLLAQDMIHSHDGLVHLPRLAAYFRALSDGHFPVRWAGYLNYGYGLPLFNFIYHVPYWVGSIFLFLGVSLVLSFKLSLVLGYLFSGIFMFLFARLFFRDERKGLLVAVAYQFMPFHLVEVINRASFGSIYAYAFLPLALFAVVRFIQKNSYVNFIFVSVSIFLLVYSHNSLSLIFFGVIALFVILFAGSLKSMVRTFLPVGYGLLLSAFYWLPALLEHKYTYGDLFMQGLYKNHFAPLSHFLIPNILNNPQSYFEGANLNLGIFHILAIVITLVLLYRGRIVGQEQRKLSFFALVIIVFTFFFMTPLSRWVWDLEISSFLRQFQFPWRFLALIVFASSLLFANFLYLPRFKRRYSYFGLVFFTIIITVFQWRAVEGYDKNINEEFYWNFPLNTTYYGETDVIWSAGPAAGYPGARVEVISGAGDISNLSIVNHQIEFDIVADTDVVILTHTQYFPGWRASVDGEPREIQFQDPNHRGNITFSVPAGKRQVVVHFGESAVRFIADMLSLLAVLGFIPLLYVYKKVKK